MDRGNQMLEEKSITFNLRNNNLELETILQGQKLTIEK